MRTGEICTRDAIVCNAATTIMEASRLMREYHVGTLVVVEDRETKRYPVGIVTDRDIVVEVIANEVPLDSVAVGDIMSREVATADESRDAFDTLQVMQGKGIRRMPVVDQTGVLIGIVTLDDLLEILAEELATMVKLVSHEQAIESKKRPARPGGAVSVKH